MKINIKDSAGLIEIKNITPGECFKYWPSRTCSPSSYHICMRTDGRFCITDCMEAWPVRFVDLKNGDEHGTSGETLVEKLRLQVTEI